MKILVVDDDMFIHEIVTAALAAGHHDLHHAYNAAEGAKLFRQEGSFDLVITDIVMPGEDGTKLIKHIKGTSEGTPVLAMTGGIENTVEDYVALAELYADFTLAKPFTREQLQQGIKSALDQHVRAAVEQVSDKSLFDKLAGIIGKYASQP